MRIEGKKLPRLDGAIDEVVPLVVKLPASAVRALGRAAEEKRRATGKRYTRHAIMREALIALAAQYTAPTTEAAA